MYLHKPYKNVCKHTKIIGNIKHFYYNWSDLQSPSQHGFCLLAIFYYAPCPPLTQRKQACTASTMYHLCSLACLDCWPILHASDKEILTLLHVQLTSLYNLLFPKYFVNSLLTSSVSTSSETVMSRELSLITSLLLTCVHMHVTFS